MFYPQAMTDVEMILPEKDLLAVTKVLAGQGVFHQIDASYQTSEMGISPADSWQEKATAYAALERRILATMQALDVEEGPPPAADQASMIEIELVRPLMGQIEQEVQKASEQLDNEHKKLEELESYVHQLAPVAGISLDIGALRNPRYLFSMVGLIPVANLERLQTSLARIPFVLLTLDGTVADPQGRVMAFVTRVRLSKP